MEEMFSKGEVVLASQLRSPAAPQLAATFQLGRKLSPSLNFNQQLMDQAPDSLVLEGNRERYSTKEAVCGIYSRSDWESF